MNLIFSDVEGTLYSKSIESIDKRVIESVSNLKNIQADIDFIICTGMGLFSNLKKVVDLFKVRYVVSSLGALIYDMSEKQVIFSKHIDNTNLDLLIKTTIENNGFLFGWDDKNIFVSDKKLEAGIKVIREFVDPNKSYEKIQSDTKLVTLKIIATEKDTSAIWDVLKNLSCNNFIKSRPTMIEISPMGVSKGTSVKFITELLKSSSDNVMTIGDSGNDIPMFKESDYSYAMANASQAVKDSAKYHTTSYDQNGLGMAIADFIYRKKIV